MDPEQAELSGYGARLVADLLDHAEDGRITASSTVRDLLAGSGVALDSAGVLTLGPAGDQLVFTVVG